MKKKGADPWLDGFLASLPHFGEQHIALPGGFGMYRKGNKSSDALLLETRTIMECTKKS